jgi:hypothetical protein
MPVLVMLAVALLLQSAAGSPLVVTTILLALAAALQLSFSIRKYRMSYYGKCGQ